MIGACITLETDEKSELKFVQNPNEGGYFVDLDIDGIILEMNLKNIGSENMDWIHYA
jgi:hypothetical protein